MLSNLPQSEWQVTQVSSAILSVVLGSLPKIRSIDSFTIYFEIYLFDSEIKKASLIVSTRVTGVTRIKRLEAKVCSFENLSIVRVACDLKPWLPPLPMVQTKFERAIYAVEGLVIPAHYGHQKQTSKDLIAQHSTLSYFIYQYYAYHYTDHLYTRSHIY